MTLAKTLVTEANEMRTFPHVAMQVTQLTGSDGTSLQEVEELIRLDPVLVSRILKMVNSVYYGLRLPAENISKAIVFLGMKNLRNVVVLDAIKGYFLSDDEDLGPLSSRRLFAHGAAVGTCAQFLSRRMYGSPGEDAFLAGILHDIGLMVEDQTRKDQLEEVVSRYLNSQESLPEIEQDLLGTDHCTVGLVLAQEWSFSAEIQDVIAHHHLPVETPEDLAGLRGLVQIAESIVGACGYEEIEGRIEEPKGLVKEHLVERAEDFEVLAEDFIVEMKAAEALINA